MCMLTLSSCLLLLITCMLLSTGWLPVMDNITRPAKISYLSWPRLPSVSPWFKSGITHGSWRMSIRMWVVATVLPICLGGRTKKSIYI
jgi:hypothetical protein